MCLDDSEPNQPLMFADAECLDAFDCCPTRHLVACCVHGPETVVNVYKFPDNNLVCTIKGCPSSLCTYGER